MLLRNIKAIVFDFWGVVAMAHSPMYDYMRKHGVDVTTYRKRIHRHIIAHDLGHITEKQFLKACSELVGLILPYEYCHYNFQPTHLNKPLIKIIKQLKQNGFAVALLSNNNYAWSSEFIFKPKLNNLFDPFILSYQVGCRKPYKKIYKLLINKLRLKPEQILFIDDMAKNFPTARTFGLKTHRYKRGKTEKFLQKLIH